MKPLFLSLILFSTLGQAIAFDAPDVVVATRVDQKWSTVLIGKLKKTLSNYKIKDPFTGTSNQTYVFDQAKLENLLPEASKAMLNNLKDVSKVNIVKGRPKVELETYFYEVKGLKSRLVSEKEESNGLTFTANINASEFHFASNRLSLSLLIPIGERMVPLFIVDIINPTLDVESEEVIDLDTNFKIYKASDEKGIEVFKLKVLNVNLEKFSQNLKSRSQDIELNYERIDIRTSQIQFGTTIKFEDNAIKDFIEANLEGIKGLLLTKVAEKMNEGFTPAIDGMINKLSVAKDYLINAKSFRMKTSVDKLINPQGKGYVGFEMPLNFCTHENFKKFEEKCFDLNENNKIKSRLDEKMHSSSVKNINRMIEDGDANIVASISEDLITKMLNSTHAAGIWESFLTKSRVFLGPNKAKALIDEKGDTVTVVVDVIHKNEWYERIPLLFNSEVRLAIIVKASIRLEVVAGQTVMIARLVDADTTNETLLKGRPEIGAISTLDNVGPFKYQVTQIIRNLLTKFMNKDLLTLPLPDKLQGLGLEDANFVSDGTGRMNAYFDLEKMNIK